MSDALLKQLDREFPTFAAKLRARPDSDIENVEPPATDEELSALEESLGIALPKSYKRFLQCARGFWILGGSIQFGSQHPFFHDFRPYDELTPQQQQVVQHKSGGKWPPPSEGMLCFAEFFMEADGDQVLFDVARGMVDGEYPIMYYAHESRPPTVRKLADAFPTFIGGFLDYMTNGATKTTNGKRGRNRVAGAVARPSPHTT
jgi:hypothetical protein